MNRKSFLWTVVALSLLYSAGCSHDVILESTPQFQGAAFYRENRAWLTAGKRGLLRTFDAGKSWQTIEVNNAGRSVVHFVDEEKGWIVTDEGMVWHSQDAGNTWSVISKLGADFNSPVQLIFIDELHGWLLDTFSIWRTQDGGVNWSRCFHIGDTSPGKGQPVRGFFLTHLMGWVAATDGEIHRTLDGGRTWHSQTVASSTSLKDVFFMDELNGWLGAWPNGGIYNTNDGGLTWHLQLQQTEKQNVGINSICFTNANDGWAAGQEWPARIGREPMRGVVFRTHDGGRNWQAVEIGHAEEFFERIYFPDPQHGWLISRDRVYRSDDSGKAWKVILELPPQVKG